MTSSSSSSFEDERNSFETSEYYSNWGLEKIQSELDPKIFTGPNPIGTLQSFFFEKIPKWREKNNNNNNKTKCCKNQNIIKK